MNGAITFDNSLKFGLDGVPRVAYDLTVLGALAVYYASYVGNGGNCGKVGRWQCDLITDFSWAPSLDVALSGWPRMAYVTGPGLKLATYVGNGGNCGPAASWTCDTIDPIYFTAFPSLYVPKCVFACTSRTQIAYHDGGLGALKYAKNVQAGGNCGPSNTWQCDSIDNMGTSNVAGRPVALAVDGAGMPLIAYQDSNDQSNTILKVARNVGYGGNCGPTVGQFAVHTWQCDVVDGGRRYLVYHCVGQQLSIALNSAGLATIAYYDASSGDLLAASEHLQTFLPLVVR